MELRHLRYFTAVAEERHFGRAAKRLHIAQPPLSRQIQALEEELGFPLLTRSRRSVEVTPAGTIFLEETRRVFELLERAVHDAARASRGESGRVTVGYVSSLAYSGLTDLLRAYRHRFPSVEIVLHELPPSDQLEALSDGRIDVGFVRGSLEDDSLRSERVRKESLMVALPQDHPLANRRRIHLSKLAREPFVMFPRQRGPVFFDQLIALCRGAGFSPRIVQEAPQLDMSNLVAAGFGVSIMPSSIREVRRPGLVLIPIVGSPQVDLWVVWRAANALPAVREFLDVVRRVVSRTTRSKATRDREDVRIPRDGRVASS